MQTRRNFFTSFLIVGGSLTTTGCLEESSPPFFTVRMVTDPSQSLGLPIIAVSMVNDVGLVTAVDDEYRLNMYLDPEGKRFMRENVIDVGASENPQDYHAFFSVDYSGFSGRNSREFFGDVDPDLINRVVDDFENWDGRVHFLIEDRSDAKLIQNIVKKWQNNNWPEELEQ